MSTSRRFVISVLAILLASESGSLADEQAAETEERADARLQEMACAAYGPGYEPVPGTTTCIKVGGHVQVDVYTQSRRSR